MVTLASGGDFVRVLLRHGDVYHELDSASPRLGPVTLPCRVATLPIT
jgi:hypothetical protein